MWRLSCVVSVVLLVGLCLSLGGDVGKTYEAVLLDPAQVYDGDTIQDVRVNILPYCRSYNEVLWPGVEVDAEGVWVVFDLRISGIDTPEKRPSTKTRSGEPRSADSRSAEKAASLAARQALIDLLGENDNRFTVVNPIIGKYAGRFVGDMYVGDVNVADYLIGLGHAKPYAGGTKPVWNF